MTEVKPPDVRQINRREFLAKAPLAAGAVAAALVPPLEAPVNPAAYPAISNENGVFRETKERVVGDGFTNPSWLTDKDGNNYLFGLEGGKLIYYKNSNKEYSEVDSADKYCAALNPTGQIEILFSKKGKDNFSNLHWGVMNNGIANISNLEAGTPAEEFDKLSLAFGETTDNDGKIYQIRAYSAIKKYHGSPHGVSIGFQSEIASSSPTPDSPWLEYQYDITDMEKLQDVRLVISGNSLGLIIQAVNTSRRGEDNHAGNIWFVPGRLFPDAIIFSGIGFGVNSKLDKFDGLFDVQAEPFARINGFTLIRCVLSNDMGREYYFKYDLANQQKFLEILNSYLLELQISERISKPSEEQREHPLQDHLTIGWFDSRMVPPPHEYSIPAASVYNGKHFAVMASIDKGEILVYKKYPDNDNYPNNIYRTENEFRFPLPKNIEELKIQQEKDEVWAVYICRDESGKKKAVKVSLLKDQMNYTPLLLAENENEQLSV